MPHVLGLKQETCVREPAGLWRMDLVRSGAAAASSAEIRDGQDKRSCKQSADQRSNTCAPCPQHTYGERLWEVERKAGG